MGHAIIRGNNVDEKFASANKALMQLERRIAARSIVAPLTPIIISGYCKEDDGGVIARVMVPVSGFIAKVSLHIETLEDVEFLKKNSLEFYIESHQPDGMVISKRFVTKKMSVGETTSFKISSESRVTVSINTKAFGIWYSLILEPETPIKRKVDVSDMDYLLEYERAEIEE